MVGIARAWVVALAAALVAPTAGCCKKKDKAGGEATEKVYAVGDKVEFPDSTWVVVSAKSRGKTLTPNNPVTKPRTTEGRFIQVVFKITNKTKKHEAILVRPKLIDDQQREFGEVGTPILFIPNGKSTLGTEPIPPSMTKEFYGVYEVAADAKGLKFRARPLTPLGKRQLVDLGL